MDGRLEEIHERVLAEGSITDKVQCPRCGSTKAGWAGGDMSGLGDYYDMYLCEDCGRRPNGLRMFLVPISKEDYDLGVHPSNRGLTLEERTPKCHIHGTRMSPVAWEINSEGKTTGTDYACDQCGKERKPGEPVCLSSGPIIEYYRPGVLAANGERIPY